MAHIPSKEMLGRLEESARRFELITDQLSQPEIISRRDEFLRLSKERSSLESFVDKYHSYKKDLTHYQEARHILETERDSDLRSMANEEIGELEPKLDLAAEALQLQLLPRDPNDEKNILLVIRAGVGGDEAGIFVGDLYRMYQNWAGDHGCKTELMSAAPNSSGGFKEIIALIEGEKVFSQLKYESGAHRVQRVPKTEAQGRVHTSTATVAVLPEAEEVELIIEPKDLRIDVFRAGGHGGQSVNTTDSAVRITPLPTNEVVVCQDEKSQLKNKNKAMKVLRSRILERMRSDQANAIAAERRSQVGGGFRNERIRTYNFPQGRVTDHRIGMTEYNIDKLMAGDIDPFIRALSHHYQLIALKGEDAVKVTNTTADDD